MKLLFDQNLSPRLATLLDDLFPGSSHVYLLGMDAASDAEIWDLAQADGWVVVTRDADFADYSAAFGFPPYVVQIRLGNCPTAIVHDTIRANAQQVLELPTWGTKGLISFI